MDVIPFLMHLCRILGVSKGSDIADVIHRLPNLLPEDLHLVNIIAFLDNDAQLTVIIR